MQEEPRNSSRGTPAATAASSIAFGETFGPLRLAGMVTVVGGIAVMLLSKRAKILPEIV